MSCLTPKHYNLKPEYPKHYIIPLSPKNNNLSSKIYHHSAKPARPI